ncbi:aldo/keto reductase [Breznakia pachnodae]|uniref:Oxidoreductase n=1 Tax=Breznakia pachnodae TaxID=265178 RepID=A0ABU0E348_9FIRM|nr:aldo/keto reductase [Breznakia pachnodae]MDQ0361314.1 putative oxidoreductase [Breznakia pachnodae]
MKYLKLGDDLHASQLIYGVMRTADLSVEEMEELVKTALDEGVNFFDHADIYGAPDDGACEQLFGEVLKRHPEYRKKMILQTKCGIMHGSYDFSKKHILESVDKSLERLQTDYIDILLLHRPDALYEPEEIAEAFDELERAGKVRHFGVSNMPPMQIDYLQSKLNQKLIVNQLHFNPAHAGMLGPTLFMNTPEEPAYDRDGYIIDYTRLHNITIQAWSIFQPTSKDGTYLDNPKYQELNDCLEKYAKKYNVEKSAIVVAWIMRHPAHIQPIFGTTKVEHLKQLAKGVDIELDRLEWYDIYNHAVQEVQ